MNTHYEMVRCADMHIDYEHYQRPFNQARANKIAKHWDENQIRPLEVSVRANGDMYLLDGQHENCGTLLKWGDSATLPARMHYGLTIEQEAEIFHALNTNFVKPAYNDTLKARVAAGDVKANGYIQCLSIAGIEIDYSRSNEKKCRFVAHRQGESAYRRYGFEKVVKAFKVIRQLTQPGMWRGEMVPALAMVFCSKPDADMKRLVEKLEGISELEFIRDAKIKGQLSSHNSIRGHYGFAKEITDIYNKGMKIPAKRIVLEVSDAEGIH